MDLIVRQPDGSERTTIVIDEKTVLEKGLMGDDVITCPIIVSDITGPNSIQVDDYIVFQGNNYYLNRPPEYSKLKTNKHKYTFFFEGEIYKLLDKMFIHPTTGLGDFYIVENAEGLVDLLLQNINQSQSTGWTKGTVWSTDRKNIYFEGDTCRNVLNKIANNFGLEFYLVGKQINFVEKFETPTILSFQVGRTTGLYELKRQNVDKNNTITRAYLYGSTKNITADYRNGSKRLIIGNRYIENTTHFNRIVERNVIFDEVYPRFNGAIESTEAVNGTIKKFVCSAIDFDIEAQQMNATPPKVVFLTGDLSGKEFTFSWDNAAKAITLEEIDEDGNVTYPNADFYPRVGDEFTLVDIIMPQSYIDAAEAELLAKGTTWLNRYSQLRVKYELNLNPRYLRDNNVNLNIGDVVRAMDTPAGIDQQIRIVKLKIVVENPYDVVAEIANVLEETWEQELENRIQQSVDQITISSQSTGVGDSATRDWVGLNFARLVGDNVFFGDMHINGNIYQNGEFYETHVEHIYSANDLINVRDGAATALGANEYAGLKMLLADGTHNLMLVGDSAGVARVGWENGVLQAIATRENSPLDGGVAVWSSTDNWFRATKNLNIDMLIALEVWTDELEVHNDARFNGNTYLMALNELTGQLHSPTERTIVNDITAGNISIGNQFDGVGLTHNQIFGVGESVFIGGLHQTPVYLGTDNSDFITLDPIAREVFVNKQATMGQLIKGRGLFRSGFTGENWQIHKDEDGNAYAEFDYLTIRKSFNVYELVANQIRGTNGAIWVSDTAKVSGVMNGGSYWRLSFDTEDGSNPVPFTAKDIIRCQVFTGTRMKYYSAVVTSIGADYINISSSNFEGIDDPEPGDVVVRVGNIDPNSNRQGAIYLTSSDTHAPYIEVIDEVDSFNFANKGKVRIGALDGITDPLFGQLEGYGLWSENVYLRGKIEATEGEIGGWTITNMHITSPTNYITLNSAYEYLRIGRTDPFVIMGDVNDTSPKYPNAGHGVYFGNFFDDKVYFFMSETYKVIAGWNFDDTALWSGNNRITLRSSDTSAAIYVTSSETSNAYVSMYYNSSSWGLQGRTLEGALFQLGSSNFIAGWTFDKQSLWSGQFFGVGAGLELDGTNRFFSAHLDALNYVQMYYTDGNNWGLKGYNAGEEVFSLGNVNSMGGFSFDKDKLYKQIGTDGYFEVNSSGRFFVGAEAIGFDWTDLSGLEINVTSAEEWKLEAWHQSSKLFGINKYGLFADKAIIYAKGIVRKVAEYTSTDNFVSSFAGGIIYINRQGNTQSTICSIVFNQTDIDEGAEVIVHITNGGTTTIQAYNYQNENSPIHIRTVAAGNLVRVKIIKTGINQYISWEEYRG
ncbi:phage tail protein [Carboxylicivirga sediminis]|uniref:Phage tail protein n=1 Tax=Carboxylicivirga sediminis TaxID=2006564 RepID=A0A941IVW6_9BACT|nr:phage tail protein [Carboxylicivirga sediminis]MBR8535381.1 phage tail protein [Carboxylicivirga sediminis]